jgi:hypothetical protein
MPSRDPLAVLARLRRLETDQARRLLADRLARGGAATGRAEAAAAALVSEAAATTQPGDYGAWLTRGLAERARAEHALLLARQEEDAARQALAAARSAERAVETLAAERARRAAREALRADQARLDDRAATRPRA